MGHIKCNKISCPILDCDLQEWFGLECCPICTGQCLGHSADKIYEPNEMWFEISDDCIECKCINGKKDCITESCVSINCAQPIKKPGSCCKTCPLINSDF